MSASITGSMYQRYSLHNRTEMPTNNIMLMHNQSHTGKASNFGSTYYSLIIRAIACIACIVVLLSCLSYYYDSFQSERLFIESVFHHVQASYGISPSPASSSHASNSSFAYRDETSSGFENENENVELFIGIFTRADGDGVPRRAVMRDWAKALSVLEIPGWQIDSKNINNNGQEGPFRQPNRKIMIRYIVGTNVPQQPIMMEEARSGPGTIFLTIPVDADNYDNLSRKSYEFFKYVTTHFPNAAYIAKIDDDVIVRPNTMYAAMQQWMTESIDYISCMRKGPVHKDETNKWFEPMHNLIGKEYWQHGHGPAYALSSRAAKLITSIPFDSIRKWYSEDVTVGSWALFFDTTFSDDARMCRTMDNDFCNDDALVVYSDNCPGFCEPIESIKEATEKNLCGE